VVKIKTNELTHFSTNNVEEYPEEDYHLDVEDDLKDLVGDDVSLNTIFLYSMCQTSL
jgi:hypothetical protein